VYRATADLQALVKIAVVATLKTNGTISEQGSNKKNREPRIVISCQFFFLHCPSQQDGQSFAAKKEPNSSGTEVFAHEFRVKGVPPGDAH
jgi:hypothetical protein